MLQARSNKGKLITLATLSKAKIEYYKKQSIFFCPTCNQQVIIKAGSKVIPHFAHQSKVKCPSYEGGEGSYHEKGKHLLFQWLKAQKLEVTLEKHIPEINQRPDLLLKINGKRIAIEFQCARVAVDQIQHRNEGYMRVGIIPIWILGANRFKRLGKHYLKIDQFTLQFMHQFTSTHPLNLFYFCPNTLQLITFQHIHLMNISQAVGKFHFSRLNKLRFTDIFIQHLFLQTKLYTLWKREKKKFRLQHRKHLYGNEQAWRQWLYLKQTHLEYLPSIVHLPVSLQYRMKTQTWNWQSRLCIDILQPLQIGNQFTLKSCVRLLQTHLYNSNHFPLIKSRESPISQYLQLLEQLEIIKQTSPDNFKKLNPLKFHHHIEDALKGDEIVMNQLFKNIANKIQA